MKVLKKFVNHKSDGAVAASAAAVAAVRCPHTLPLRVGICAEFRILYRPGWQPEYRSIGSRRAKQNRNNISY